MICSAEGFIWDWFPNISRRHLENDRKAAKRLRHTVAGLPLRAKLGSL
jgi:hypothetical protein